MVSDLHKTVEGVSLGLSRPQGWPRGGLLRASRRRNVVPQAGEVGDEVRGVPQQAQQSIVATTTASGAGFGGRTTGGKSAASRRRPDIQAPCALPGSCARRASAEKAGFTGGVATA